MNPPNSVSVCRILCCALCSCACLNLLAKKDALFSYSFEELIGMKVTSVSLRNESLLETAASVHVITDEDIRRSGYTDLPNALRLAPGIHVGMVDEHSYAIGSRGMNDRFTNKLLVMIDGRSVYTQLFSGTYWDIQDIVMEDSERIEVIRGPGATVYGANAVNVVINIVTKTANNTQGSMLSTVYASDQKAYLTARHGFRVSKNTFMNVYGKRSYYRLPNLSGGEPSWNMDQAGFRIDSYKSNSHYT